MDEQRILNDVLTNLFGNILKLEEKALICGEFTDISVNDMHILDAIGKGEGKQMSAVAKKQRVTLGTLTSSMNGLVKKGYVERFRSEEDRRVVIVSLTQKGRAAYDHHETFHREMVSSVLKVMKEGEAGVLAKCLKQLETFFTQFSKPGMSLNSEVTMKKSIG